MVATGVRPTDLMSCQSSSGVNEVGQDENKESGSLSWFNWGKKKSKGTNNGERPYEGNIVIADRGGCMFEEKAIHAQADGAEGVIVVNSEVILVI